MHCWRQTVTKKEKWKGYGKKKAVLKHTKNHHSGFKRWRHKKIQNVLLWKVKLVKSIDKKCEIFWTQILSFFFLNVHSHLVAALYNPPPTAGQTVMPLQQMGGLNASLQGSSVVVSLAWESITHSLSPLRFSLLVNGFASGQRALHLQHLLPCFHLKKTLFSLAFLLYKSHTETPHTWLKPQILSAIIQQDHRAFR